MNSLPTLKKLLLALILAGLGLSSVTAQSSRTAAEVATTEKPALRSASDGDGSSAAKSAHSSRRHHRRAARNRRVQNRHQQRHHKGAASQTKLPGKTSID
jgi:hypothetical protein